MSLWQMSCPVRWRGCPGRSFAQSLSRASVRCSLGEMLALFLTFGQRQIVVATKLAIRHSGWVRSEILLIVALSSWACAPWCSTAPT